MRAWDGVVGWSVGLYFVGALGCIGPGIGGPPDAGDSPDSGPPSTTSSGAASSSTTTSSSSSNGGIGSAGSTGGDDASSSTSNSGSGSTGGSTGSTATTSGGTGWTPEPRTTYSRQDAPNPIVAENQKIGDWDWQIVEDSFNHEIEGYADDVSVEAGQSIGIHVNTSVESDYTYAVYRFGDYNGVGAHKVVQNTSMHSVPQAACPRDPVTSMIECSWPTSFTVDIGSDWVSGVYLVKLHRADGHERYVHFVVRDHRNADILLKIAFDTAQAYNAWGGESLYVDHSGTMPDGKAFIDSFERPYDDGAGTRDFWWWERYLIGFLERNGYDVTYGSGIDMYRFMHFADGIGTLLTGGHDEYWTQEERDALNDAINNGQSVVQLGANPNYWRIRLEPDSQGNHYRHIVCYKATQSYDPELALGAPTTARFRDPPNPEPESGVFGAMYEDWMLFGFPLAISDVSHPFFANTGFSPGDTVPGLVGYEYDNVPIGGVIPQGLTVLATSPLLNAEAWPSNSQVVTYSPKPDQVIFSAGSIYWPTALSENVGTMDARIWRMTWNVLETSLVSRRVPRPLPSWTTTLRTDGSTQPHWARSVLLFAGTVGVAGEVDGTSTSAQFTTPVGVAVGADGAVYVSDSTANRIRMIKNGQVTTIAGGIDGDIDGPGLQARFRKPVAMVLGPDNALYVADSDNHQIRRIGLDVNHTVTTFAGAQTRSGGYQDGPASQAFFNRPEGLVFGPDGTLYVADTANMLIRSIGTDAQHTVHTLAGSYTGDQDGPSLQAALNSPTALTFGNDGALYLLDSGNAKLKQLTLGANPTVTTFVGGGLGYADGAGPSALLRAQGALIWTNQGLVLSDSGNHRLRLVQLGATPQQTQVFTLAGTGKVGSACGTGDQTTLSVPTGLAVDASGTVYVVDSGNSIVRTLNF